MVPVFARLAATGLVSILVSVTCAPAQSPQLPMIPANVFSVTNYGAIGDGITTNTTAIQNAINAAFAAGGGTVEFPSNVFLSGPLNFSNSINLQLDAGAILRMLPYPSWPGGSPPPDVMPPISPTSHGTPHCSSWRSTTPKRSWPASAAS